MTEDIKSMVFAISNWSSDDLDWLQHGACTGTCDPYTTLSVLKNLKFKTSTYEKDDDQTLYMYSNVCAGDMDQSLCGEDCLNCQVSWPFGDTLGASSSDAACRCLRKEIQIGYAQDI